MTKEKTLDNIEYHYEAFDNGCTLSGEELKMCAIGDEDTIKLIGNLVKGDIEGYCNFTCSNKVKITIKIESED